MKRRLLALLLALAALPGLAACGGTEGEGEPSFTVRAAVCQRQTTLDPARVGDAGGQTIVAHLFENLLRWEPGPDGEAVLGPGQAESYSVEESYDGSVTYTFTLRRDLKWSDGEPLTAGDFLYTWRRLFDQEGQAAGITRLYMLRGYYAAHTEGDLSGLGVAAPDDYTFVITLDTPCAYFLETFCAGTMTMPVPEGTGGSWGGDPEHLVCNGPYVLERLDGEAAVLTRNGHYWDSRLAGPDRLEFYWEGTYEDVTAGTLDLVTDLPAEAAAELAAREGWQPEPALATCALLLNNAAAPFDNELVRQALAAALDRAALVEAMGSPTETAATGIVPRGVTERGLEPEREEPEAEALPLPAEEEPEEEETVWDFRSVGDANYLPAVSAGEERQALARELLSQAGYPGGRNFPAVEYLYVDTPQNRLAAQALAEQWKAVLNIDVATRGMGEEELRTALLDGTYACAGFDITAELDDASQFLNRWETGKVGNLVRGSSQRYDLLIEIASKTFDPAAREAYLHDAEAILIQSCGVVPLFYYGRACALAEGLEGLLTRSTGLHLLQYMTRTSAPSEA